MLRKLLLGTTFIVLCVMSWAQLQDRYEQYKLIKQQETELDCLTEIMTGR